MTEDEFLSHRLTRAIGHCVAEFARANPAITTRAVMAAQVSCLVTVGEMSSTVDDVCTAVRQTWAEKPEAERKPISLVRPPQAERGE